MQITLMHSVTTWRFQMGAGAGFINGVWLWMGPGSGGGGWLRAEGGGFQDAIFSL